MRRALPFIALGLCSCEPVPPSLDRDSVIERAQLVRQCPGGMYVGRDPVSKRLVWSNTWSSGLVANGVTVEQACGQAGNGK